MRLSDYTHHVRDQLVASAALGDERTQQIAGVLAGSIDASVRLAILDAVSAATVEVTTALADSAGNQASPAVTVHIDGDELRVVVAHPPVETNDPPRPDDGEANARISLRLSETLKADIEQAAARSDLSVNTWLVRAAANALRGGSGWTPGNDWSGGHPGRGSSRITGWVTG
jgi:hypothetical protein